MGKAVEVTGKVLAQELWWKDDHTRDNVTEVTVKPDYCGRYFFRADNGYGSVYRGSFEEVYIKHVKDNIYHVGFMHNSSQYVRSDNPFLLVEMTKDELVKWHNNDYWFESECWYVVRRKGKRFTKSVRNGDNAMRCMTCRYLITGDPEQHVCKQEPYYTVNDNMETVEMPKEVRGAYRV